MEKQNHGHTSRDSAIHPRPEEQGFPRSLMKEDNSVWYQHEGHDRVHTIQEMVDCLLEGHPSIHNKECEKLVSKVQETLFKLYQKIGEWEAPCDVCGEKETYSVHTFCSKCKHIVDDVQMRDW